MAKRSNNISVYSRGEETRARILEVAVRLFGTIGFDGVTTRMIAAEAGVPAPSLRYYFDNKEGLYLACWASIQAQLGASMESALVAAEALLAHEDPERTLLIDALCALQAAYLDHMIERQNSQAISHFITRHDLAASSGARKVPMGDGSTAYRLVTCFTSIIQRISRNSLDWQSALLVAGLVNGQVEHVVAKRSGLAEIGITLDGDRLAWLRRTIRQQTIAALLLHCS